MISVIKKKIKQISSMIKVKEAFFAQEMAKLVTLKEERNHSLSNLNQQQKLYITGVDKLNRLRSDPARQGLEFYEESIDLVKNAWISHHKAYQYIDKAVKQQGHVVIEIKRQIDGIEKLKLQYEHDLMSFLDKKEQEYLDEITQRKSYLERKNTVS